MKRSLHDMLNARLEEGSGTTRVGFTSGEESVVLVNPADIHSITDKHGKPEYNGYLYDKEGNILNKMPWDSQWMEASFSLEDLLKHSSNYYCLVVMAGKMGYNSPTKLLDPIELRELERLETQIREAMKKQRDMKHVKLDDRDAIITQLKTNLKSQREFVQRLDTLEVLFAPTAKRWSFLLTEDPFWSLTRRVASVYRILYAQQPLQPEFRLALARTVATTGTPVQEYIAAQLRSYSKSPQEYLLWAQFLVLFRDFIDDPKEDLFERIQRVRDTLQTNLLTHLTESSLRNKNLAPMNNLFTVIDTAADLKVKECCSHRRDMTQWPSLRRMDEMAGNVARLLEKEMPFLLHHSEYRLSWKRAQYFWMFVLQQQPTWTPITIETTIGALLTARLRGQGRYENAHWSIEVKSTVPVGRIISPANARDIDFGLFFIATFAKNTAEVFPIAKDIVIVEDANEAGKFYITGDLPAFSVLEVCVIDEPALLKALTTLAALPVLLDVHVRTLTLLLSVLLTTALVRKEEFITEFLSDFVAAHSTAGTNISLPFETDLTSPGLFGLVVHALANVVSLGRVALVTCFREMIMSMFDGEMDDVPSNTTILRNPIPQTSIFKDMMEWRLLWDGVFKQTLPMVRSLGFPMVQRTDLNEGLANWTAFNYEWVLDPVFNAYNHKKVPAGESSYPQMENEVTIDFETYDMLNLRGTLVPLDEDFVAETKMPQLRFLNIMSIYHYKYMPTHGAKARRNTTLTETAISEAKQSMAQLATNGLVFAQANVFDLIKRLFIPSQAWEMQAKLAGRVKLSSPFVASMAKAESAVKHCLPKLYGPVPLEALTCEKDFIVPNPLWNLFFSDFSDLISYEKQQIDLDFGSRYNSVQQHTRPATVLQNIASRLRSYRLTPAGGKKWQIVKV